MQVNIIDNHRVQVCVSELFSQSKILILHAKLGALISCQPATSKCTLCHTSRLEPLTHYKVVLLCNGEEEEHKIFTTPKQLRCILHDGKYFTVHKEGTHCALLNWTALASTVGRTLFITFRSPGKDWRTLCNTRHVSLFLLSDLNEGDTYDVRVERRDQVKILEFSFLYK